MVKIKDVCRVRSKNAGPYWVTIDFFFKSRADFEKYADSEMLGSATFVRLFSADPNLVKRFMIDELNIVKVSYSRTTPQGGVIERDLHCGQQYVRLLDVPLTS